MKVKTLDLSIFMLYVALIANTQSADAQTTALKWYKGNLHSHTINSEIRPTNDRTTS